MSKKCDVIKDLLPLYADEVCSDESRREVEEHIRACPECKAELEKLRWNVAVSPQKDADVLKRIKRRLRIEKLVVCLIALVTVLVIAAGSVMLLTDKLVSVDYEEIVHHDPISVEVDDNGDAWLLFDPADADIISTGVADENANVFGEDDFDKEKKSSYLVFFMKRKITDFGHVNYCNNKKARYLLFNSEEHPEFKNVFYWDVNDKEKHIIWERG